MWWVVTLFWDASSSPAERGEGPDPGLHPGTAMGRSLRYGLNRLKP